MKVKKNISEIIMYVKDKQLIITFEKLRPVSVITFFIGK